MNIAVIADDLTGANATGVRLSKQGLSIATLIRGSSLPAKPHDVVCFDTDSRYKTPEESRILVKEAIRLAKGGHPRIYCKRIDSTLRGNIGSEIDVVLDELGHGTIAIVVPSFPDSARFTVGGFLMVHGQPLQETDAAKDPLCPIISSQVTGIIGRQSRNHVSSINIDKVLEGKTALASHIEKEAENGNRIIVIDAITEKHIEVIAEASASLERQIVPVDPGPFTAAYAKNKLGQKTENGKILMIVGSATSLTENQLNDAIQRLHLSPVYVNPEKLATFSDQWQEEIEATINKATEIMKEEKIILVTTCHPKFEKLDFKKIAEEENASEEALSKRLTDGLATISYEMIKNGSIAACFLSGGDVTSSICTITSAKGIELKDEVLPLAAYGHFIGGAINDLPVVTKGGMVGDKKAIYDCVNFLTQILSRKQHSKPERNDKNDDS